MKYKIIPIIFFLSSIISAQNGIIKTYTNDRKLESEISYINDLYDGTSYWYYPNGNIQKEINYSEGKVNGWVREYYESGLLKEEYFVNNGVKDGNVKLFYENGGLKEVITYDKGKFISSEKVGYDKNFIAPPEAYDTGNRQYEIQKKQDNILCEIEICPAPIGGIQSIEKNILYPEHAKLYGLEGVVTLLASISEKGEVQSTQIIKGIGLGCDEAAIDAVKKTKFMPGQNEGKFVPAQVSISIPFILNEKSEFAINYRRHKPVKTTQVDVSQKIENAETKKEAVVENEKPKDVIEKTIRNKSAEVLEYKIMTGSFINLECDADVCPQPKGGFEAILKNLVTPQSAFRKDIKGDVIVIASVDKFGFVRDTKVIQGLGYGCDEAVEVAILGTRFFPAEENGEKIGADIIISVPIRK